ncbi:MAG: phenylalanine--tRNA ligase subunit beta [Candidatus Nanopelagicales bacterium]|jgi:phenylalanyl-tRNA synthetase beta chain|nr:phenylalanine--tRNA ligase subunit beta [Candidatus Nanopelagicales bacterium]
MRAPLSWIRRYAPVPADQAGRDVAARLIAAGLEVETVHVLGADVTGPLVVGRVLSVEELTEFRKPIRYCRVAVGPGNGEVVDGAVTDERGIICGASNFMAGDLVVVALPGAVLPGGFAIGSRETYGRLSDGMITSERELGLGDDHAGIIVLPAGSAEPGDSGYEVLGLGDEVLDIAVTPDRGYALSIRGIAREVATAYDLPFDDPALVDPEALLPAPSGDAPHGCSISDPSAADRFVLRSIAGLDPSAPSPQWMRRALVACGMRPVSLAVDVTNYVMLELGQPLHAFDRAKLRGPLTVRRAAAGEVLETLDHTKRALDPEDVVIADPSGPLAVAGIMGGLDSEIDDASHAVAIEAVHFSPVAIARGSRRHRLSSEASRRFERGVDPALPAVASARAAALLIELGGATYVGVSRVDVVPAATPLRIPVDLPARVSGLAISGERALARLEAVGAAVVADGDALVVTPPPWRPDLTDPYDLVEEVVRLEGYQHLPSTMPHTRAGYGLTAGQRLRRRVGRALAASGLVEVLSYPFVGVGDLDALGVPADDPRRELVRLANPISDEAPFLRTTLLPGLVAAARRNLSRGAADLALAEVGPVFRGAHVGTHPEPPRPSVAGRPSDEDVAALHDLLPDQPRHVAGLLTGERDRAGWWGGGRRADWSDALAVVRELAEELGVAIEVASAALLPWHPGRCAAVSVAGTVIGHAGELHPRVVEALDLPPRTVAFELDLDALLAEVPATAAGPTISTMPVAKEDLAVVVAADVPAERVRAALLRGGGALLESVRLFDTYEGAQVGEGRRSLAFALRMRAPDRTLSAAEVAEVREAALAAAQAECGAVLRT